MDIRAKGGETDSQSGGISLLYVEDESDARQMVGRMLAMNYPELKLSVAENGALGLQRYREIMPDIVMTDINMPVMDGIRMSREIKAINPEAHIIAVTAHSDTSYLLNAIEIGIHHYVLKPINYDELFAVLGKIMEQIALKRLVGEQQRVILESERQLAGAQRIAHLGSWQLTPADGAMIWSEELYRILGIEPGSVPASYRHFLDRLHPDDRDAVQKGIRRAVADRQPVGAHFCRVLRPDGSQRVVRLEAEPVLEGSGAPAALIGTAHDVTELKQAEAQVRTLTDELERRVIQRTSLLQASVRELDSFSYFVSHDLRAPVARLEGFCRAMIEDCANCGNQRCGVYAERAERAVRQIKQIIDAFNSLSHFTRCKLAIEEVDLSATAGKIASGFQLSEPDRRVEFRIAGAVRVRGDAGLLHTALEHLLGNAWKFTSKSESGRIEFGSSDLDGERVYFVRDNGAGFDMKYLDKLFKPFQTIHTPGEYSWDGTAIGLAVVHSIILRHGGRVWAKGETGKGATFYFTLDENPETGTFMEET